MIRKKPAPHLMRGGYRFSEKIMLKQKQSEMTFHLALPETARMNSPPERHEGTVDPKLLEILVCPLTKGPLEFDAAKQELISRSAKLAYPIRDGIPIMLPEEARKIE
jgi:uncharacterized protein YbaR (Trm112 family)